MASLVFEEGKKNMHCGLIRFLKSSEDGLRTDQWLNHVCGLLPVRLILLDEPMVWMDFTSEKEVELMHSRAAADPCVSPFFAVEKWMEVLGHPPRPCWVRIRGVPLHILRESVFRKLGDCLGKTIEVDEDTISQANLQFGRVKSFWRIQENSPPSLPSGGMTRARWWKWKRKLVGFAQVGVLSASRVECQSQGLKLLGKKGMMSGKI